MASMLTTVDNPHDPRLDFDRWNAWDMEHGYFTCAYLSRVASVSEHFPQEVQDAELEAAMREILEMHAGGIYKILPVEVAA